MRQVLWPKYLLGGMLQRGSGIGGAAREGTSGSLGVGRWPDADVVLQGGMSEGLRDWDLWYDSPFEIVRHANSSIGGLSSFASCFQCCCP